MLVCSNKINGVGFNIRHRKVYCPDKVIHGMNWILTIHSKIVVIINVCIYLWINNYLTLFVNINMCTSVWVYSYHTLPECIKHWAYQPVATSPLVYQCFKCLPRFFFPWSKSCKRILPNLSSSIISKPLFFIVRNLLINSVNFYSFLISSFVFLSLLKLQNRLWKYH